MQTYWLAIDEDGNETIHQYEPHYNKLHRKWRSTSFSFVSPGFAKLVIPSGNLNESNDRITLAKAFELDSGRVNEKDNKCRVLNTLKIY